MISMLLPPQWHGKVKYYPQCKFGIAFFWADFVIKPRLSITTSLTTHEIAFSTSGKYQECIRNSRKKVGKSRQKVHSISENEKYLGCILRVTWRRISGRVYRLQATQATQATQWAFFPPCSNRERFAVSLRRAVLLE